MCVFCCVCCFYRHVDAPSEKDTFTVRFEVELLPSLETDFYITIQKGRHLPCDQTDGACMSMNGCSEEVNDQEPSWLRWTLPQGAIVVSCVEPELYDSSPYLWKKTPCTPHDQKDPEADNKEPIFCDKDGSVGSYYYIHTEPDAQGNARYLTLDDDGTYLTTTNSTKDAGKIWIKNFDNKCQS